MPLATSASSLGRASALPASRTIVAGCDKEIALAAAIATATGACLSVVGAGTETSVRAVCGRLAPDVDVELVADRASTRALRRVAAAKQADLLVIGRRSLPTSPAEKSSALRWLDGAPCAVLVAPATSAATPMAHLGVGVDSTHESRTAMTVAHELARRCGASLELFAVVDDGLPAWLLDAPCADEIAEELVTRRLNVALDILAHLTDEIDDVAVEGRLLVGDPSEQLLQAGRRLDMLVIGSRHGGPTGRLGLGTTSDRVLHEASCPVLAVPSYGSRLIARNRWG
jgi:nucleotide-binding universal stress UspA family protein